MSAQLEADTDIKTDTKEAGLLPQIIAATKQTAPDRVEQLLRTLTDQALAGTVTFNRNFSITIRDAVDRLDALISRQLGAIMQAPEFSSLEGSWRGQHYLVQNSETGTQLKLRMLNVTKQELQKDLARAVEFDQSHFFKAVYEAEFGSPGGEPIGTLIGDYSFGYSAEDVDLMRNISGVAAASFAPFIAAAAPAMFGFDDYRELSRPRDMAKIFETSEYIKWRSFRETEDARFMVLTMPRVLARLPYAPNATQIEEFNFDETAAYPQGKLPHENYCWMNAAYVFGARLTDAFAKNSWCTAIRGAENGGKTENLPLYTFISDNGDIDLQCPTEIGITDRRDAELGKLGFMPLCHYKNTDYAVFFGAQTTQKPSIYDSYAATSNAAISARLPYILATSRFAHFLKVLGRDKIGSFMEASDCEAWLNRWISAYVNANEDASADTRAKYPLRDASISVEEVPGRPGVYNAVAWMRPWLQMEELTTSLRLVARIPAKG
ncbi:type VI secretion system contractile sheath large subunit [Brucella oryzae]|uniref:Type VI secretion system contractile sheath large subunit n=1 Tax=Brucella oryzae TaxID=335286 RepID=A0A2S7J0W9_9HYPH|nr:type VI secretion system contractile sheath large subunit [Brucella oryzae]PQA73888.1 type VI secretion system contractile sheath large subunit [Brucella oryzae]